MSKRPIRKNSRGGTPSPQPMGLSDPKRSHSVGVDNIEANSSTSVSLHSRMDSPELPSTDEEEVITILTSQLNDSKREVTWLKQRIRKFEALFGIAPDEEIPSPATHHATINETMAALTKNATHNHVTTAAFTATTASSSKRNSAQSDAPTPAEAYQRAASAAPAQPTIPTPPRHEPTTATPSTQTPYQSASSATKPENLPAATSQRPATSSSQRHQVETSPTRQSIITRQTPKTRSTKINGKFLVFGIHRVYCAKE
ncbi:unnamed protein product [Hermetia illucens]|uniref:Uncharacterized protein n=1 Tax=Hermetia illucens TaxID=343691 RepID=A0A7R8UR35_HERIL|nr:unnamed protein product [Hermetia illucens]